MDAVSSRPPLSHLGRLFPRHLRIAAEASPMKSVYLSPIKPVRTAAQAKKPRFVLPALRGTVKA
jgi:hypothetical protein